MSRFGILLFALVAALARPVAAETLHGVVVGISDGDTLTLLTANNTPVRIRLAEIDAPELHGQPFGTAAKSALSALTFRRRASADVVTTDQYGRCVALVAVDGVNVNAAMVRQGLAWAYLRYQTDPAYSAMEAKARAGKLGLWSVEVPPPIPPWQFRRKTLASVP
jgi:micrococcal nuclease